MKQAKRFAMHLALVLMLSSAGIHLQAQNTYSEGQMAINGGISYGFDVEELGIRAGLTYFLNEDMRVGGDFTYWLIDSPSGMSFTYLEINGNFNYIFYQEDDLMLYGIGALGIHYASVSYDNGDWAPDDYSDTDLGLGLGVGLEYNLGGISLFAEPKIFLSGFDQAKFNIGVRYYL